MSSTTATTITTTPAGDLVGAGSGSRVRLWRAGLAYGAAAAAATCVLVLAARAGGADVAIAGEQVPLVGFAQLTMIGAVIGIGLAKAFARRARHPRSTFVRTTVALTALSVIPDFLVDATPGSMAALAATHVLAAVIIVPALATRLHR